MNSCQKSGRAVRELFAPREKALPADGIWQEYLTVQFRVLTPAILRGMRMADRALPPRIRRKYGRINIGEVMVLANVAGA